MKLCTRMRSISRPATRAPRSTLTGNLPGPYHALPWLFGLPMGSVDDTLTFQLQLVEQSNGNVLWSDAITQRYAKTEGIYYNYGDDFGYPEMFREEMKQGTASLAEYVTSRPVSFWDAMAPAKKLAATTRSGKRRRSFCPLRALRVSAVRRLRLDRGAAAHWGSRQMRAGAPSSAQSFTHTKAACGA